MNKKANLSNIRKFPDIIYKIENAFLVGLLLIMILVATGQIVMRNFFGIALSWGEVLVRILVLWIGMAGAMIASRKGNHIRIDLVARYLPNRLKNMAESFINLFSAIICTIVAYYACQFVISEFQYGGMAFADIPVWICESIIPIAFSVISFRYYALFFISLKEI